MRQTGIDGDKRCVIGGWVSESKSRKCTQSFGDLQLKESIHGLLDSIKREWKFNFLMTS